MKREPCTNSLYFVIFPNNKKITKKTNTKQTENNYNYKNPIDSGAYSNSIV